MNLDFSERYAARPLTASDADAILTLCAENEQFYRYHPPLATKESVLEDLSALPPGKSAADKHYLGFFDGETLVAVLDLILDYPQEGTAYLGFFMTKKAVQGRGIGSALIGELLDELREEDFRRVRLAVDRGNPQSKAFWEKNGFALMGEEVPHGDCDVTRSVSKMTEIERRGGKRWDKPKKAGKSRDCRGGKF